MKMSIICKKCKTENEDGSRYCAECSEPLDIHSEKADIHSEKANEGSYIRDGVFGGDVSIVTTNYINGGETPKECHICGKVRSDAQGDDFYKCPCCEHYVCKIHYDTSLKMCNECAEQSKEQRKAEFFGMIQKAIDNSSDYIFAGNFEEAKAILSRAEDEVKKENEIVNQFGFYWNMLMIDFRARDFDEFVEIFAKKDKNLNNESNFRMAMRKAATDEEKKLCENALNQIKILRDKNKDKTEEKQPDKEYINGSVDSSQSQPMISWGKLVKEYIDKVQKIPSDNRLNHISRDFMRKAYEYLELPESERIFFISSAPVAYTMNPLHRSYFTESVFIAPPLNNIGLFKGTACKLAWCEFMKAKISTKQYIGSKFLTINGEAVYMASGNCFAPGYSDQWLHFCHNLQKYLRDNAHRIKEDYR